MKGSPQSTFEWEVTCVAEGTGQTVTEKVRAHWSPDFDGIKETIKEVAAVQAWWKTDKRVNFAPIEVVGGPVQLGPGL